MSDTGYTDPAARYVSRLAGYDQRLQLLERSHVHPPDTPVGAVVDWPGSVAPVTWAFCDGSPLLVAAYPDLFGVLGYLYGGSGPSFNLPDLRSRVVVGAGVGAPGLTNRALGAVGGAETVALTNAQTGIHAHVAAMNTGGATVGHVHTLSLVSGGVSVGHTHNFTSGGGSVGHNHGFATGNEDTQHTHVLTGGSFGNTIAQSGTGASIWGSVGSASANPENFTHAHSGTTGGVSADHAHSGITGGINTDHAHTTAGNTLNVSADHAHSFNGPTDGGACYGNPHENMPPYTALNKIIKVATDTAALAALTIMERTT